jgi:hypothetical protein
MSFSLDIVQSTLVKKTKPGVVRVYDYYNPGMDGCFDSLCNLYLCAHPIKLYICIRVDLA